MIKKLSILVILMVSLFSGIIAGEYLTNYIFDIKLFAGITENEILTVRLNKNEEEIALGIDKHGEIAEILDNLVVYKKNNSFIEIREESPAVDILTDKGSNIKLILQDDLIIVNGEAYVPEISSFENLMNFTNKAEKEVLLANT